MVQPSDFCACFAETSVCSVEFPSRNFTAPLSTYPQFAALDPSDERVKEALDMLAASYRLVEKKAGFGIVVQAAA